MVLMTVLEPAPATVSQFLPKRYENQLIQNARAQLSVLAEKSATDEGAAQTEVRFGSVYREIIACAQSESADLIVMGSHAPNVADYLLGSNAARVVRHSPCSVHIVRHRSAS